MRKVVGAKAEELGFGGNLIGHHAGARQFDHGAHQVLNACSLFLEDLRGHAVHNGPLVSHLFERPNQGNHHLRQHLHALAAYVHGGLENGLGLNLRNFRIGNAQPASAISQHGIELMQLFHAAQHFAGLFETR